ncbi:MAG: efflux RND transporter permease subunit [Acidobacteria bacterium]|nr:MAG: efflux RND transporter permease subunit [Acidobacteriota bacterium]
MKVVEGAIKYPVTTAVGVLLVVLFGLLALFRLPVQMAPVVEEPQLTVTTVWPGASPLEIEREIVDEQEEQLQSLEGLVRMKSTSQRNMGVIELTFQTGTDIDAALLQVNNRLQQVPEYPADAERPVLAVAGAENQAAAWFVLTPTAENPFSGDLSTLQDLIEDTVVAAFERVPGVAASDAYGGRQHEMHVVVDPARLAARRVTLDQLVAALERENRDFSGGDFVEGKRRYVVRTVGSYESEQAIEDVVVAVQDGVPIYVRDVANVELGLRKWESRGFYLGTPTLAIRVVSRSGANVLDVMKELKLTAARLDQEVLAPLGLDLLQVYDETEYIEGAIGLVKQSLLLGAVLAIAILMLFLRSPSSTLVVAVAIPISIVGTFLLMLWLGRSLNVVSLAGMAFAVGMVVDNSIVVLENIYRHRQLGKGRVRAAYEGAREVWGAVLASTLTTIAVFVPVLFVREEAGQLFRDIALAIACAVGLSLVVAMTVIPSLSAKILETARSRGGTRGFHDLWGMTALAARAGRGITGLVYGICGSTASRLAVVAGLTALAVGGSILLAPETEYLPSGNRNFILGVMNAPPGYSVDEMVRLQQPFVDALEPLWAAPPDARDELPGGGLRDMFFFTFGNTIFVGASAGDPDRVGEVLERMNGVLSQLAGVEGFIGQVGIFQRDLGPGRGIDVDVVGPDLERLVAITRELRDRLARAIPGSRPRTEPELNLSNPELRVYPDRRRAAELGLSNRQLGIVVSALVDGIKASDYRYQGREIDLVVIAEPGHAHRTHLLEQMPIATPNGQQVTLGDVARLVPESGPTEIRHVDRHRAFQISLTPPESMPLSTAMGIIEREVLGPLRADGTLAGLYRARLSGNADKLTQTGRALGFNLVLAVVITYLLMAALFESFLYPLVILFSVPLAGLGGILGLAVLNLTTGRQALDVLTMLGFIILVGTVVNNAILIVHQTLNHLREGERDRRLAIREAVRNRIRPIFMSVATSVGGMLPLVLFPGPGSELYRGLGSVVVGGLVVSTIFTLFLVPALLSLVLDARAALRRRLRALAPPREPAVAE